MSKLVEKRWPWLLAAGVVLLLWGSTFVELRGDADPRPTGTIDDVEAIAQRDDVNVLFILIDTLRADHLSAYGYERKTSPLLDHLADNGIRFGRHLAQSSWTKASMASLWTGVLPARTGVLRFEHVLSPEATLPAELFKQAGFRTTAIYRNGWVSPYFGFDQGFDYYERPSPQPVPPSLRIANPTIAKTATDVDVVEAAKAFLRSYGDERFFLYLHLMDVHEYVYDDDHAVFGSEYADVYDNSILRTNTLLDGLMSFLAEEGLIDKTVIAIASDHGEAFGERGIEGHARYLFRESTEVPFLISLPFRLDPGVVVEARTRNIDVWPTLLDLMGLPAMPGADGVSLMPEIRAAMGAGPTPEPRSALAHLDRNWGQRDRGPHPTVAVAEGTLRYVYMPEPRPDGSIVVDERLFDRGVDAAELQDLGPQRRAVVRRMREQAESYLKDDETAWTEAESLELDEMQLNQLRALGYQIE